MEKNRNIMEKGFLETYRNGGKNEVNYIPLKSGFLKLEYGLYDDSKTLSLVSYVLKKSKNAPAIGPRLEMMLYEDRNNDEATYISENGVSGLQWTRGEVIWGRTYDDDAPPGPGRKVLLTEWVDDCIDRMINPSDEEIAEREGLDKEV